MDREARVLGALWGGAIGDAAGLPWEGLSRARVARRFERVDRFRLAGRTGFVSDDTEQTALLAHALVAGGADDARCVRRFRRSMVGWLARLPFGIGGATLRACVRMALGWAEPGVRSAGNGAAMRAGVLGVHLADDPDRRRRLGRRVARLTHTDERAVQGALFVADVAAACARSHPGAGREEQVRSARRLVDELTLARAIDEAVGLAAGGASVAEAAAALGSSGFVVCSVGLCTYCFLRFGDRPMEAIAAAIQAGGDTDTHGAIVGGWVGALHGADALPSRLVRSLHDGPFGPTHLEALASAMVQRDRAPRWSWIAALARNLALYPVILAHGFARLVPW